MKARHTQSMLVNKCSALSLLDGLNLTNVKSWDFTDRHAADVVRLRKPSRKATRQTKKLESSLHDKGDVENARVMRDAWLLPSLESTNFKSEDRAADVVRLRKLCHKSTCRSPKLDTRQAGGCTPGLRSHLPKSTSSTHSEQSLGSIGRRGFKFYDKEDKRPDINFCMAPIALKHFLLLNNKENHLTLFYHF